MPVTELALLHLVAPTTASDDSLLSTLREAKKLMEGFTGRRFYYLQQVEDPSYIYVLGEWDSHTQHTQDFIPGKGNQAIVESLKGKVDIDWLLHLDVSHDTLPIPGPSEKEIVYSMGRHFIKPGEKAKFAETFRNNKRYLDEYVTEGNPGGGWRVDGEEGKDEYVLFCPWTEVDQHLGFQKTEGFQKYRLIVEHIGGAEIKHAKVLEI